MKRLLVIAALIAFAMLLALGAARATTYGRDAANPACTAMRNNVIGAPYLPEPNRDDTRKAMGLAGGDTQPFGNIAVVRRQYAQAFELLQKIDSEGTDRLALLPSDTPRIDLIIDRHVVNLVWARTMLGTFYEQGRAPRIDYPRAGAFFQKALDTSFVDERGCIHTAPVATLVPLHLAGIFIFGEGVAKDRDKAKALLRQAGGKGASILYLLDKNIMAANYAEYLNTNFDNVAENVRNPPPKPAFDLLTGEGTDDDAIIALLGRILLWCAAVVALFVGGVGLFKYVRRKQGYKDETSIYRTLFAVYDVLHGIVARFGLVAEGLIGCFLGLSMLVGGFAYGGFGNGVNFIVFVSGATAILGGLAKIVEAARGSMAPKNTLAHGAARPAAEPEAHDAARGVAKTPDLHNRTFKE